MKEHGSEAEARGDQQFSHFGPEANLFAELEDLFRGYGESGTGRVRKYLHDDAEAAPLRAEARHIHARGRICPHGTDLLFYEGLHGAVVTERSMSRSTSTCSSA